MERTPGDDYPDKIKSLRAKLGLTQVALAETLGVSFPTVNRWENGKPRPSPVCWARMRELVNLREFSGQAEEFPPKDSVTLPPLDFTAPADIVRTLVEGERLSFGHLVNSTFATEIARIDPLPHQRIAVYEHMLRRTRLRFLLADDAGAGKTIMTGLYIREMLLRRLIRRVLIVPPAGLVGNWQHELANLFGLGFEIIDDSDARAGNPFIGPASDHLIVSVDTLAGSRMFARLGEPGVVPYDLVVFDEAHKLSCDRGSDFRVRKTARYRLAEALAGVHTGDPQWRLPWHGHHLLLLTATPHMGKDYPYYALWRLLEPDMLTTIEAFEQFPPEQREHHFIRRTKEEMVTLDGKPLYPRRIADTLGYELTGGEVSEQRLYEETTDYLRYVYNKPKLLNQSAARLAMSVLQRRLASSTHALLCSFERRIEKLDRVIDDMQQGRITIEQLLTLQRRISEEDDIFDSKAADEESGQGGREENETAEDKLLQGVIAASLADLIAERQQVEQLRDLARRVRADGTEAKFEKLREVVGDPRFAAEKLIVFTEHRDTLDFLVRQLEGMGYTGQVAMIHGGMHYTERQRQVEQFRKTLDVGGARFMICTDAAAEGINLQFCWIMINYDIPWNPARLEQRMGRIHRYGQAHDPVIILNLVAPATREGRVLKTLLDKLEAIRRQLDSDKVYDSVGRLFAEVSIKHYMELAVTGDADAIVCLLDGQLNREQVRAITERERRLYGDGGDVKRLLPSLRTDIEQEAFRRLLPGYVRHDLVSAAPLIDLRIDGDPDACFTLQASRSGALDALLTVLETYPPELRECITVQRPDGHRPCIWFHPGEPVFECFRELVAERLGGPALQGAVFVDPSANRPYLFHLARLTVVREADAEFPELSQQETVECRLIGVRQYDGADIEHCPVEHLLLLRAGRGLPPAAQRLAVAAVQQRKRAWAYLEERLARELAVEQRSQRIAQLPEREAAIIRGHDFREAELAAARARLTPKARTGNQAAEIELSRIKHQQRELKTRRDQALAVLRREPERIMPGEIVFIAHALVVPSTDPADRQRLDAEVEHAAMERVRAFEEAAGATVSFVHTPALARAAGLPDHPGFDVLSIRSGERRCIEVKGRAGSGEIEITDNEWARACNLRWEYWLYVVYHCATPTPQMIRVQDPFEKLLARPFARTQIVESTRELGGVRITQSQIV